MQSTRCSTAQEIKRDSTPFLVPSNHHEVRIEVRGDWMDFISARSWEAAEVPVEHKGSVVGQSALLHPASKAPLPIGSAEALPLDGGCRAKLRRVMVARRSLAGCGLRPAAFGDALGRRWPSWRLSGGFGGYLVLVELHQVVCRGDQPPF